MNEYPFVILTDFCEKIQKGESVRNYAYCIYESTFIGAVKNYENKNGIVPKNKELKTIKDSLLTDEALSTYVSKAEKVLEEGTEELLRPYVKSFQWREFLISTGASIFGAFWYSILLLILFKVGGDQIRTWLQTLLE